MPVAAPPIVCSSYRSNFYIPQNIIGYTGCIHNNPSVYFLTETEFGHITQAHHNAWNIGRETVGPRFPRKGWNYVIENELDNGVEKAIEKYVSDTGELLMPIHPSRSKYIDCRRKNMEVFALLSQAIWSFKGEKVRPART